MTGKVAMKIFLLLVPLAFAQKVVATDAARVPRPSAALSSVAFADLGTDHGAEVHQTLISSLTEDGLLAIKGVPGLAEARRNAFAAIQSCFARSPQGDLLDSNNEPSLTTETLADGTLRQSIGTQVKPGNDHAELSHALLKTCPGLREPVETLRETVDKVSSQLMFALDDAFLPQRSAVGAPLFYDRAFSASGGNDYMSTAGEGATLRKYAGNYWKGFSEATQGAIQLEHFHSYTPKSQSAARDTKTLNYHTDAGLFLLFVPAWYSHDPQDLSPTAGDFRYLDKNGAERTIVTRGADSTLLTAGATTDVVGDDSLIMMVGKGAEDYLTSALRGLKMRAVPHALTVAPTGEGQHFSRNWYGRMFLPPTNAYLAQYKMSYGELRGKMISQSRDPLARAAAANGEPVVYELDLPAGCEMGVSSGGLPSAAALRASLTSVEYTNRVRDARQKAAEAAKEGDYPTYASLRSGIRVMDSCAAGEIWCWHTCENIASYGLTCPASDVICMGPDGQPANPDDHNTANQPGCKGMAPSSPDVFCVGTGVNMYMEGFVSYVTGKYRTDGGSATPSCMVLWFSDWKLDSEGKFAAACIGCILFGIFTEFLGYLRRTVRTAMKDRRAPEQIIVMSTMYALQLGFGYFCMLIAMTYQVELFVCVVVGLGAGHAIFSFKPLMSPDPATAEKHQCSSKGKSVSALDSSHGEEEVVDPCCLYMADSSEHALNPIH